MKEISALVLSKPCYYCYAVSENVPAIKLTVGTSSTIPIYSDHFGSISKIVHFCSFRSLQELGHRFLIRQVMLYYCRTIT